MRVVVAHSERSEHKHRTEVEYNFFLRSSRDISIGKVCCFAQFVVLLVFVLRVSPRQRRVDPFQNEVYSYVLLIIFAEKMENVVLLSTTSEKTKIRKNEIQYFIVQHFPFFRQKLSVVLNCTPRSEKGRRAAAVETP